MCALRPGLAATAHGGDLVVVSAGALTTMLAPSPLLPAVAAADAACAIPSATKGNRAARKRISNLGKSTRDANELGDADEKAESLLAAGAGAATATEDMMA